MAVFNQRLAAYVRFMQLAPRTLSSITGIPVKTVNAYLTAGEWGRTPTWNDAAALANTLYISLDYLSGGTGYMWPSAHSEAWPWIRARAAEIREPNPKARLSAVVRTLQERIAQTAEPWFVCGLLNLGNSDDHMNRKREHYQQFLSGIGTYTVAIAAQRLADFTGLPRMWLLLAEAEDLPPATDVGPWARFIEEAARRGHRPDEYVMHLDTFDHIIRTYQRNKT